MTILTLFLIQGLALMLIYNIFMRHKERLGAGKKELPASQHTLQLSNKSGKIIAKIKPGSPGHKRLLYFFGTA